MMMMINKMPETTINKLATQRESIMSHELILGQRSGSQDHKVQKRI